MEGTLDLPDLLFVAGKAKGLNMDRIGRISNDALVVGQPFFHALSGPYVAGRAFLFMMSADPLYAFVTGQTIGIVNYFRSIRLGA